MNYKKYRWFYTSSGKLVIAGKNAEQNEEVIKEAEKDDIVMHTALPGSPFVVIKGKARKQDTKEAAIFCAKFSQAWKKSKIKKDIEVHYFKGKDIFKEKNMKTGTFGVRKFKKIIVKKRDIEKFGKKC